MVNCPNFPDICFNFHADGYPTLMLLEGNMMYEFVGNNTKDNLAEYLKDKNYLKTYSIYTHEIGKEKSNLEVF